MGEGETVFDVCDDNPCEYDGNLADYRDGEYFPDNWDDSDCQSDELAEREYFEQADEYYNHFDYRDDFGGDEY